MDEAREPEGLKVARTEQAVIAQHHPLQETGGCGIPHFLRPSAKDLAVGQGQPEHGVAGMGEHLDLVGHEAASDSPAFALEEEE